MIFAIIFAYAGTTWRQYIYTNVLVIMALYGFINGYLTSRSLKFFSTTDWNFSAFLSALVLPLFISGSLLLECGVAWIARLSQRYSFGSIFSRIVGWYLLNGAMCYFGAYKGYI